MKRKVENLQKQISQVCPKTQLVLVGEGGGTTKQVGSTGVNQLCYENKWLHPPPLGKPFVCRSIDTHGVTALKLKHGATIMEKLPF